MKRPKLISIMIIAVILVVLGILLYNIFSSSNNDDEEENMTPDNIIRYPDSDEEPALGITVDDFNVSREDLILEDGEHFNYWYVDERGFRFEYRRESGRLVSIVAPREIYKSENQPTQYKLSGEEMQKIADDLISHVLNLDDYERENFVREEFITSDFNFVRFVNGYRTEDSGTVAISRSGDVIRIMFHDAGLFDNIYVPPINEEDFDRKFEAAVLERDGYMHDATINISGRTLVVRDGNLYLNYAFAYRHGEDEISSGLQGINIPIPGAIVP